MLRICIKCNSDKTYIKPDNTPNWYKHEDGHICKTCYNKKMKYHEKYRDNRINWMKINPDRVLKSQIKYIEKLGLELNMNYWQIKMALLSWSETIRGRDQKCKICNSQKNLIAHHILYKSKYPKLMFDLDNGVGLCSECHSDFHNLNG